MFSEDITRATTDDPDLLSPEGACAIYERLIQYAETNPGFASNRMVNDYREKLAEYQQKAADEKERRMQLARRARVTHSFIEDYIAETNRVNAALYGKGGA